jgi:Na+(H+)/acetate symporter ActP
MAVGVVCIIVGIVFVLFLLIGIISRATVSADIAAIEQLRADSEHVRIDASHDVIGQVTEANQHIIAQRQLREKWIFRLVTPHQWETVPIIAVPR